MWKVGQFKIQEWSERFLAGLYAAAGAVFVGWDLNQVLLVAFGVYDLDKIIVIQVQRPDLPILLQLVLPLLVPTHLLLLL